MTADVAFFWITWPVVVVYALGCWYAARRWLQEPVRTTAMILAATQAVLVALYMLSLDPRVPIWWNWFFNIHTEFNPEAMFSSAQYILVAAAAAANFLGASPRWQPKLFWGIATAGFVFLGLDEYFSIHELDIGLGHFREIYVAGGLIVALVCGLAWWFGFPRDWSFIGLWTAGGAIMVGGGIVFEPLFLWPALCRTMAVACVKYNTYGESLETSGTLLVLCAALLYLQRQGSPRGLGRAIRGVWITAAAWGLVMVAYLWISPAVEVRLLARPLAVESTDGNVSLLGYTVSPEVLRGESRLNTTLYWQAHRPIDANYIVSVHLVSVPDIASVAQVDWVSSTELSNYPSVGWLPGVPVRMALSLNLPADLPASHSYWLIVRLWDTASQSIPLTTTDRQLLSADTVVLQAVPAVSPAPPASPPAARTYDLGASVILYGFQLPRQAQAGRPLAIDFWWRKSSPLGKNLSQFVHFIAAGQPPVTFDGQPFAGAFPVADWPLNVGLVDHWQASLPADMPPGEYNVSTGLYEWPSLARLPAVDEDGQTVENASILLGAITVNR